MKKLISTVIILTLALGVLPAPAYAYTAKYSSLAGTLNTLGLLSGTNKGNELDQRLTRTSAAVIITTIMGKSSEAESQYNSGRISHPFRDVPSWANAYVAYLYSNGVVSGVSSRSFGTGNVDGAQFTTMVLRVLGYSDTNGDFSWKDPYSLSAKIGLLTQAQVNNVKKDFYRDHMALIVYNSLSTVMKDDNKTLLQYLVENEAVSEASIKKTNITALISAAKLGKTDTSNVPEGYEVGNKAPDFTINLLSGKTVSLSDYKGKAVFINFWATWNQACTSQMADVEKVFQKYGYDIAILAVSSGEPKSDVQEFISEKGYSFPVALDTDSNASVKYGIESLPRSFFINKNGIITGVLYTSASEGKLVSEIDKAMK